MNTNPGQASYSFQITLAEEKIQVSPGSSARVPVTVTNTGRSEDFLEIVVKGMPNKWVQLTSPVIQLGIGERKEVNITIDVPPPPEGRAGQYPLFVQVTSQGDPGQSQSVSGELTVAAFRSEGRIGILLENVQYAVAPGGSVTIPIQLHNRGLNADTYVLGVEGIPTAWISTSSAKTRLDPGEQKGIRLTITPPKAPQSTAGRNPFRIRVHSQTEPGQAATADCILNIAVFTGFSSRLNPEQFSEKQISHLIIQNDGNAPEVFTVELISPDDRLYFQQVRRRPVQSASGGTERAQAAYTDISGPQNFRVEPGQVGDFGFRALPRSQPVVGGSYHIPFIARVQSKTSQTKNHDGEVSGRAIFPTWLPISAAVMVLIVLCLIAYMFTSARSERVNATQTAEAGISQVVGATQTAAANQTQAVSIGQEDTDGDGLTNSDEINRGTDPVNADSDGDELMDGNEVISVGTDPLNSDTDGDGLSDGDEVLRRSTDPLNADTDGDGLTDALEVQHNTDPFDPDSDDDGATDGFEVDTGTDPLNPDSDNDQLLDGEEDAPCPDPLNPDSDGDGIIDGKDLNSCDPNNPSLTATAVAGLPSETPAATAEPTETQPVEASATTPPDTTPTEAAPQQPGLSGIVLFESNREGNLEIYAYNTENQSLFRLTDNSQADSQPVLEPASRQIVYVSNIDNNNEIVLSGIDQQDPINLTNNPADDTNPVWSPDGQWIAFTTNRDGNQEIYIMRSDGTELRNLTNNAANDFAPSWFETTGFLGGNEWIAFTTDRDGNQEIYLVSPDGEDTLNLSNNAANDYSPSAAKTGDRIAFTSERDGNPEIYLMDTTGNGQTNLTNNPARDSDPAFGPTGEWIAFTSERDGNLEVYVIRTDGQGAYNLTQNPAQDTNPSWQ